MTRDMSSQGHDAVDRSASVLLMGCLCLATATLVAINLWGWLPSDGGSAADDMRLSRELFLQYSLLPRLAVALLAGAALGLSGSMLQAVLRNPMAEPATLGISAGAQLSLTAATLFAPSMLVIGQSWIALLGGGIAITLAIRFSSGLSPLSLVISGLTVGLICNSASSILALFHWQYLGTVFMWSSGSLVQNGWAASWTLLLGLGVGALLAAIFMRPLAILTLEDDAANALGLNVFAIRVLVLGVAVFLAALVVATVGMIGFIGLAAPNLARLLAARRMQDRLVFSSAIGALLLLAADQAVQLLAPIIPEVPAGIATALLGAPLLLIFMTTLRSPDLQPVTYPTAFKITRHPAIVWTTMLCLLALTIWLALYVGRASMGWIVEPLSDPRDMLHWRWPRVLAAMAAGCALSWSGAIMQRVTGNPIASPELLGVSSGASFGVILTYLAFPNVDQTVLLLAASGGAFLSLFLIVLLGRKGGYSPQRLILTGIAIGTTFGAVAAFLVASGDPRMGSLLSWLAGSTYRVTAGEACAAMIVSLAGFLVIPFILRWLEILPLGDLTAQSVGIDLRCVRLFLISVAAVLTASATLTVGPLTFVGLMAPQLARAMGMRRPISAFYGAGIIGTIIMLVADWLGRNILFPYQIPAGLLASLVGSVYFFCASRRKAR